MKKRHGSGLAQSDIEKASEFNGQFTDVFTRIEHSQVPLIDRLALFMEDIVVTKEGVTKLLHINDIISDIESEIRLFADDCVCYREIKDIEDTAKLQKDIDRLGIWARKWGIRFQPVKCNMMQLTKA